EDETIQHLLCSCVFSRQFWFQLLRIFGLPDIAPQPSSTGFFDWWQQAGSTLDKRTKRGFNSLVILGAWLSWKERNDIVFNGASPTIERVLLLAQEEAALWRLASAKGISELVAARPGV
ncbi:hypothetical protein SETIT_4G161900v2, partial [Setaria italica]